MKTNIVIVDKKDRSRIITFSILIFDCSVFLPYYSGDLKLLHNFLCYSVAVEEYKKVKGSRLSTRKLVRILSAGKIILNVKESIEDKVAILVQFGNELSLVLTLILREVIVAPGF